jgi:hypothetical protein
MGLASVRAIELRDMALSVVKARGAWQEMQGGPNVLMYFNGDLRIAFRTPFQNFPPDGSDVVSQAITDGVMHSQGLPYWLDVWAPRKVLNVEWADAGYVAVRGYKAGPWEQRLESLAASL